MTQFRSQRRRGAPIPALELAPPPHLDAEAAAAFREAVESRPQLFTPSDARLLTAYALACSAARRMERDPSSAENPGSYGRAVDAMIKLSRVLRLSPISRSPVEGAVQPARASDGDADVPDAAPLPDTSGASAPWLRSVA